MCGISSFIGDENAYRKILDGLLQLQNRGYDSAGISIFENGNIITHKYASSTNSSALDKLEKYNYENNHVGIGHTRWATHGAKTDTNSHPHMSFNERFVLVHNGIIENFQEIKTFLESLKMFERCLLVVATASFGAQDTLHQPLHIEPRHKKHWRPTGDNFKIPP